MRNKKINPKKVAALLAEAQEGLAAQEAAGAPRLSEEDVKKLMRLSQDEINVLNEIARGRPPRNALAILAAIRLKLEHTVTPPAPKTATAPVTVVVQSLADKEPTVEISREPQDEVEDLDS